MFEPFLGCFPFSHQKFNYKNINFVIFNNHPLKANEIALKSSYKYKHMKEKKLIIYGIGKFAEYVYYVFSEDSSYKVCGFCIESSYKNQNSIDLHGQPLVSFEELEKSFPPEEFDLFIAVGNNLIRERLFALAKSRRYTMATYVSSKATVWENLQCGENVFIDEGTMLQPFIEIGDNTILFSCSIGHHCQIGRHALLSACTLGGNVKIGSFSFLGMNSAVKENCTVGEKNFIGMGCIIAGNTSADAVYSTPVASKRNLKFEDLLKRII